MERPECSEVRRRPGVEPRLFAAERRVCRSSLTEWREWSEGAEGLGQLAGQLARILLSFTPLRIIRLEAHLFLNQLASTHSVLSNSQNCALEDP